MITKEWIAYEENRILYYNRFTFGGYGSSDIINVIFERIKECDIFIADVSIINSEHRWLKFYSVSNNNKTEVVPNVTKEELAIAPTAIREASFEGGKNISCGKDE